MTTSAQSIIHRSTSHATAVASLRDAVGAMVSVGEFAAVNLGAVPLLSVRDLKKAGLEEGRAAALVGVIRWAVTGQYTSYAKWFSESGIAAATGCTDAVMRSVAEAS